MNAIYKDPSQPIAKRLRDLLSRLTLAEKISQLVYESPAIERLGIPAYNWWNECLHGLGRAGGATVFPQAIGLAASWDPGLVQRVAAATSDEARAKHHQAVRQGIRTIYAGLTFWSPNINIFRDPRWGRGHETYGEDPYLTAAMGVAFVKGLQGDDSRYLKLAATPKHYAVHSGPEPERHQFDVRVSESALRDFYLFAFEAAVKEGRAASIMGAYNRVNGEPACASPKLLEMILRGEWGFDGYVVSDCGAIRDFYAHHQVVETPVEAAALALRAGCDLECGSEYRALGETAELGLITEAEVDRAVGRLSAARFRLGMLDPIEQVPYAHIPYEVIHSAEHKALALEAARASIVLLKNDGNLLPLSNEISTIAVIGPNADDPIALLGNYHGTPFEAITPLQALRDRLGAKARVAHALGCKIAPGMPPLSLIPTEFLRPEVDSQEFGLRARYYANAGFQGDPVVERLDLQVDFRWVDTSPVNGKWGEHFSARWEGVIVAPLSGEYTLGANGGSAYRLHLEGRLLLEAELIHHPLRRTCRVALEAGRAYQLELEMWNEGLDPQIQLLWSPPGRDYGAEALETAAQADVVVMVLGLSAYLEGEEMPLDPELAGFRGGDRTRIELPAPQIDLLKKVGALGKPIVLVLINGSALAINWAAEHVPAILEAWYPGQAGATAIAEVLFGDANPSGKLPVTFYRSIGDLPFFDDYELEGRTYRYFRGEALYPFGHGLSYSIFVLSDLVAEQPAIAAGEALDFSVTLTNNGPHAGGQVVQVYARQPGAGLPSPIRRLIGFQKVQLDAGTSVRLSFKVQANQLAIYNRALEYGIQPGKVEIELGFSSADLPCRTEVELTGRNGTAVTDKVFFSQGTWQTE